MGNEPTNLSVTIDYFNGGERITFAIIKLDKVQVIWNQHFTRAMGMSILYLIKLQKFNNDIMVEQYTSNAKLLFKDTDS